MVAYFAERKREKNKEQRRLDQEAAEQAERDGFLEHQDGGFSLSSSHRSHHVAHLIAAAIPGAAGQALANANELFRKAEVVQFRRSECLEAYLANMPVVTGTVITYFTAYHCIPLSLATLHCS